MTTVAHSKPHGVVSYSAVGGSECSLSGVASARLMVQIKHSPFGSDGIEFIKEEHAGSGGLCAFKQVSDRLFARTDVLVEDLRTFDADKVESAFLRDCRGE